MTEGHYLMFAGSLVTLYGVYCLVRLMFSRNWAEAEGQIESAYKTFAHTDAGKKEDARITYRYEVDGKEYRSRVIKAGGDASSPVSKKNETDVDRLLAKYPAGKKVPVYYSPRFPKMACLERAGGEVLLIGLVFGPIAIIVGYFFF